MVKRTSGERINNVGRGTEGRGRTTRTSAVLEVIVKVILVEKRGIIDVVFFELVPQHPHDERRLSSCATAQEGDGELLDDVEAFAAGDAALLLPFDLYGNRLLQPHHPR